MVFEGKKVFCCEQLFSLTRARGPLNPPASCLLVFPIKVAEARCQTGHEMQKEKRSWGRQRHLLGDKGLALLCATAVAQRPRI